MLMRAIFLVTVFLIAQAFGLHAQQAWTAEPFDSWSSPSQIVKETRKPAPDGLPDGLIATHEGGDITAAWYGTPTQRYGHGILGDAIEAGELKVRLASGEEHSIKLLQTEVFEDRYPRLADLDGDGTIEVVTIRTSVTKGASLTIYGLKSDTLVERARTPFIGRPNRWLNIAGIANFKGGTAKQIAYVRTPHIGGTLYFYEFDRDKLVKVASKPGFSNHAIGSREMRLSALADVNGDGKMDIVLPSDGRDILRMIGFENDKLKELAAVPLPSSIDRAIAVEGSGAELSFILGLVNSQIYRAWRR